MNVPDSPLHVLFHSPGPRWQAGVAPRDQEGIELHYAFVGRLAAKGLVVLADAFLDAEDGGMVLTRIASPDEAQGLADEDEAVRSGLLAVRVRPWRVVTGRRGVGGFRAVVWRGVGPPSDRWPERRMALR